MYVHCDDDDDDDDDEEEEGDGDGEVVRTLLDFLFPYEACNSSMG